MLGGRFFALGGSRLTFAYVNCGGTDEHMAAESGCKQHAFGPLAWKRQNDVFQRDFETRATKHNKVTFARDDFERKIIQKGLVDAVAVQTSSVNDNARANTVTSPIRVLHIHAPMTLSAFIDEAIYCLAMFMNNSTI